MKRDKEVNFIERQRKKRAKWQWAMHAHWETSLLRIKIKDHHEIMKKKSNVSNLKTSVTSCTKTAIPPVPSIKLWHWHLEE